MIVTSKQIQQITEGKKRELRRVKRPGADRCPMRTGRSYPLRKTAGADPTARIIVHHVEPQYLGTITYDQARAEGHKTTTDFKRWWVQTHDKRWVTAQEDTAPDTGTGIDYTARFDARWAHHSVWAVTFELDRSHQPRFLMTAGTNALPPRSPDKPVLDEQSDLAHGYTPNAWQGMRGEGEALSQTDWERHVRDPAVKRAEALVRDPFVAQRRVIEQAIEQLEHHFRGDDVRIAKRLRNMRALLASIDQQIKREAA